MLDSRNLAQRHRFGGQSIRQASGTIARAVVATAVLLLLAVAFIDTARAAEPTPAVTFGASVTNANGALSTRLTWSTTPAAASCAAAGHAAWTGAKAASGQLDLPAITLSGTYQLTLSCTWAGDNRASLTWVAPTQNTDGSALTNLAGFKVYRAATAAAAVAATTADQTFNEPARLAFQYTNLATGTHCYALAAFNALGVESEKTPAICKASTPAVVRESAVALTVNPVPRAPTLTVE